MKTITIKSIAPTTAPMISGSLVGSFFSVDKQRIHKVREEKRRDVREEEKRCERRREEM